MMNLAPAHRIALRGQAAAGLALNFFLNGGMAWAAFQSVPTMPIWARGNCVGGDTIGTSFFMSLITCLALTLSVRRTLAPSGKTEPIERASLPRAVRWLPRNVAARGVVVGLAAAVFVAPLTLAALGAAGMTEMTRVQVTVFKAVYTAILGAIVTPLFGLRALGDAAPR